MSFPPQRLNAPDPATYNARQQEIHNEIASGPRGGVRGPLAVWLHRPDLAAKAQDLGKYCRYDTTLDPVLSELAIMVTGKVFGSEYEWQIHKGHALKAGLGADVIEAIRVGQTPAFPNREQEMVYKVALAAHTERRLGDALYAEAREVLGDLRLVDLVGMIGYYTLISLTINIFDIPPMGDAPERDLPDDKA
ncbi:4-carboxymuconolactone decarboxylase [Celeribacter baekdonensis]|uniref:4-carboxymuconolactone decarboxylase n=1 Tax=Celeribacter baekdonensis TaxID=875171 RepID=A0A1G7T0B9_9RHOB|nr:carboxymuconolactone decarboxylase family protein [Celeribacter baekdonensis]SDG28020.1 4-carboxymuconolactone decarboxylase [Celeribacter baekdonensis]